MRVCARAHTGYARPIHICACALAQTVARVESSCALCIQLVVTSPNRTGSHALLIQSPQPSRAIEPISSYIALWLCTPPPSTKLERVQVSALGPLFATKIYLVQRGEESPEFSQTWRFFMFPAPFPRRSVPYCRHERASANANAHISAAGSSHIQLRPLTCTMICGNEKLTRPCHMWMSH